MRRLKNFVSYLVKRESSLFFTMSSAAGNPESNPASNSAQALGMTLNGFMDMIDNKSQGVAPLVKASSCIGCRPAVIVLAVGSFVCCSLIFGWFGGLVCDIVGFCYPAWMSFKAIESPQKKDNKLWLTYWVVYSAFSLLEYCIDIILFWVPFYYLVKLAFLLYLCLPISKGAEAIYNRLIRPVLLKHHDLIEGTVNDIGAAGASAAQSLGDTVSEGIGLVSQAAVAMKRANASGGQSNN